THVAIFEWWQRFSGEASGNQFGDIAALLDRGLRDAGERFAVGGIEMRKVADDKNVWISRDVAIALDDDAAGAIELGAGGFGDRFAQRRRLHAGCPKNRARGNFLALGGSSRAGFDGDMVVLDIDYARA